MIDNIKEIDISVLEIFQQYLNTNNFIGMIMHIAGYTLTWVPLYALVLFILYREMSNLKRFIIYLIIIIFISDQLSSTIIKNFVMRLRPCEDPLVRDIITQIGHHVGEYGFVSSHASNSFSVSVFINCISHHKVTRLLYIWAITTSISRCVTGVHYLSDIICGTLLGIIIGLLAAVMYKLGR